MNESTHNKWINSQYRWKTIKTIKCNTPHTHTHSCTHIFLKLIICVYVSCCSFSLWLPPCSPFLNWKGNCNIWTGFLWALGHNSFSKLWRAKYFYFGKCRYLISLEHCIDLHCPSKAGVKHYRLFSKRGNLDIERCATATQLRAQEAWLCWFSIQHSLFNSPHKTEKKTIWVDYFHGADFHRFVIFDFLSLHFYLATESSFFSHSIVCVSISCLQLPPCLHIPELKGKFQCMVLKFI